ncbi:hypothetical protein JB92DRAFT_3125922 [Gautieria morchelliformis]|nr:hypothetical protein JB92DRAFT_3125922 [Gautieria morchelliformis]
MAKILSLEWKKDNEDLSHYVMDTDFLIENWPVGPTAEDQLSLMIKKGTPIVNPVDMNG